MPNLSIKDVPEAWAQALRQRAQRNHRSLQGELMALVEAAVAPVLASAASLPAAAPESPSAAAASRPAAVPAAPPELGARKSIEQVVQALRRRFPEPVQAAPLGRDIIRAERDARGLR